MTFGIVDRRPEGDVPVVLIPGQVAARVVELWAAATRLWARDSGLAPHPDVVRVLDELQAAADAWAGIGSDRNPTEGPVVMMTTRQAAEALNVSPRRVLTLIYEHRLRARRVGRPWRIEATSVAELRDLMREHEGTRDLGAHPLMPDGATRDSASMDDVPDRFVPFAEAAQLLGCPIGVLHRLFETGDVDILTGPDGYGLRESTLAALIADAKQVA